MSASQPTTNPPSLSTYFSTFLLFLLPTFLLRYYLVLEALLATTTDRPADETTSPSADEFEFEANDSQRVREPLTYFLVLACFPLLLDFRRGARLLREARAAEDALELLEVGARNWVALAGGLLPEGDAPLGVHGPALGLEEHQPQGGLRVHVPLLRGAREPDPRRVQVLDHAHAVVVAVAQVAHAGGRERRAKRAKRASS